MTVGGIMFLDIKHDEKDGRPMYVRLCDEIRNAVTYGEIESGEKLPSIRKLSSELGVSRTTVELAYAQLAVEGFIESVPQSGYYACNAAHDNVSDGDRRQIKEEELKQYKYSFLSGSIDIKAADTDRWRKKVRNVLTDQQCIASYGEPQGELELREQLSRYAGKIRAVNTSPGNIIVGAGIQPLLSILCAVAWEINDVLLYTPFNKAKRIFEDHKMNVMFGENSECEKSYFIFVDPSGEKPLSASQRMKLLKTAEEHGGYIIEDDYNGELRTSSRPIPSVQRMNPDRVVYLGSFSKLLMPSVRLSYMVLPDHLAMRYRERRTEYNQTASKIEQLALYEYMKCGELEKQLRRLRKLYGEKCRILVSVLEKCFPKARISINETALSITVETESTVSAEKIKTAAEKNGVGLYVENMAKGARMRLSYSGIDRDDIEAAVELLKKSIE